MNATQRTLLLGAAVVLAACSGGCSRSVQVYVRNDFPFPISVHERTVWRSMSQTIGSGEIAPHDVSLAAEVGRGEMMHLQVVDVKGRFLGQVTVQAATVQAAYQDDTGIMAEVGPQKSNITLLGSPLGNPSNTWQIFGTVSAVLLGMLIAFGSWQKRM